MRRLAVALLALSLLSSVVSAAPAVQPQAITPRAASSSLVIPAAGNSPGGNGTYFRSDLTLVNHRGNAQRVAIYWLPSGVNGTAEQPIILTLPPSTVVFFEDFVGRELKTSGIGSLLIRAVTAETTLDENGRLDAFSRIWTAQPGSEGTVSQPMYAVRESETRSNALSPAYVIGLQQDARFRSNVGIVNLSATNGQIFTVSVVGTAGRTSFQVAVEPRSLTQVALPSGVYGNLYLIAVPATSFLNPTGESNYTAYGSTVDNITGDSWSVNSAFGFGGQ